jgi:hypothetical protein
MLHREFVDFERFDRGLFRGDGPNGDTPDCQRADGECSHRECSHCERADGGGDARPEISITSGPEKLFHVRSVLPYELSRPERRSSGLRPGAGGLDKWPAVPDSRLNLKAIRAALGSFGSDFAMLKIVTYERDRADLPGVRFADKPRA